MCFFWILMAEDINKASGMVYNTDIKCIIMILIYAN